MHKVNSGVPLDDLLYMVQADGTAQIWIRQNQTEGVMADSDGAEVTIYEADEIFAIVTAASVAEREIRNDIAFWFSQLSDKEEGINADYLQIESVRAAKRSEISRICNETIFRLPDFLKGGLPKTLNNFLETFDNGNQLKSNYILSLENGINVVRVNYYVGRKIYEIKVIRKTGDQTDKYFSGEVLNLVIVDDITQIKDDERRQKDLAANVSHELKTPLTAINNSVFSILNACGRGGMPDRNNLLIWSQRIQENSTRMQDIVSDFLVLSQCSHTSRMQIFDIRDCVEQAYAAAADHPGSRGVVFTLPDDTPMPLLYGNHKLIIRCIINLLTNAIKYINYDGKTARNQIHVSIIPIDDRIAVQVEDNGRGIPAKDIDHLFERFYRVDNSGSREVGGSGIGLAAAQRIAEKHHGKLIIDYPDEHTFRVTVEL